mmetsp:Transcript_12997/g.37659  ORF Transcript_12997/g.37659 Transcript_12997/m.37659 type:complete len:296 (+) Transcript_12997:36-923(+)
MFIGCATQTRRICCLWQAAAHYPYPSTPALYYLCLHGRQFVGNAPHTRHGLWQVVLGRQQGAVVLVAQILQQPTHLFACVCVGRHVDDAAALPAAAIDSPLHHAEHRPMGDPCVVVVIRQRQPLGHQPRHGRPHCVDGQLLREGHIQLDQGATRAVRRQSSLGCLAVRVGQDCLQLLDGFGQPRLQHLGSPIAQHTDGKRTGLHTQDVLVIRLVIRCSLGVGDGVTHDGAHHHTHEVGRILLCVRAAQVNGVRKDADGSHLCEAVGLVVGVGREDGRGEEWRVDRLQVGVEQRGH